MLHAVADALRSPSSSLALHPPRSELTRTLPPLTARPSSLQPLFLLYRIPLQSLRVPILQQHLAPPLSCRIPSSAAAYSLLPLEQLLYTLRTHVA